MSNSQNPKNTADLLAGLAGIVNMLETIQDGGQITDEMITQVEKVNGTCPPEVRRAIKGLNALNNGKPLSNPQTEEMVPPSSDYARVSKNKANHMTNAEEDQKVVECVEEFLHKWGEDPKLSEKFPLKVAGSIFFLLGTAITNDGGLYQMNILKVLDTTREHIVEDMLRKQTGAKCH